MKKISIIAPNVNIGEIKEKLQLTSESLKELELSFILITNQKEKLVFKNTEVILCDEQTKTNDQITMGFKSLKEPDCVIVCDFNQANFLEYLNMLVSCWNSGSKCVRVQYANQKSNFFQKIGMAFKKLRMKIYQGFLRLFGLNKYCECYNLFQLFDSQVIELFKSLPQKNAYLRNFDVMKNFESTVVSTDEKLKFKKDKFVWKGSMTAFVICFVLFVGLIVGGIFLIPIAKEKDRFFTFICLYVLLLAALLSFATYYLAISIINHKFGTKNEKVKVVEEKEEVKTVDDESTEKQEDKQLKVNLKVLEGMKKEEAQKSKESKKIKENNEPKNKTQAKQNNTETAEKIVAKEGKDEVKKQTKLVNKKNATKSAKKQDK